MKTIRAREYEVNSGEVITLEVTAVGTNYFIGVPPGFVCTSTSPVYKYEYAINEVAGTVKLRYMYFEFIDADQGAKYKVAVSSSMGGGVSYFDVPFNQHEIERRLFTFRIV